MRAEFLPLPSAAQASEWSPAFLGGGLLVLAASSFLPGLPTVTGMALVGLGATGSTIARFRGPPALVPVLLLHLAAYGGLYALFVGATLDVAWRSSPLIEVLSLVDLAMSFWPVAASIALVYDLLGNEHSAE